MMKDLTGLRFGTLTVINMVGYQGTNAMFLCKCDCGKETVVQVGNLRSGHTKSCGCNKAEMCKATATKHGMRYSSTYSVWRNMRRRCDNPQIANYYLYGGRGITVCERWNVFENFLADMGEKPIGMSIDRIDVNGNYEPSNCMWVNDKQQQNNRRNNRKITYNDLTLTVSEWADKLEIRYKTLWKRLFVQNWPIEKAFQK